MLRAVTRRKAEPATEARVERGRQRRTQNEAKTMNHPTLVALATASMSPNGTSTVATASPPRSRRLLMCAALANQTTRPLSATTIAARIDEPAGASRSGSQAAPSPIRRGARTR